MLSSGVCHCLRHSIIPITCVLPKQRKRSPRVRVGQAEMQRDVVRACASPTTRDCQLRGWKQTDFSETWDCGLLYRSTWALGLLLFLVNPSYTAQKSQMIHLSFSSFSFTWGHCVSWPHISSTLVQFPPHFLLYKFAPNKIFAHLIMSRCLLLRGARQIQESACVHPLASPGLGAFVSSWLLERWRWHWFVWYWSAGTCPDVFVRS